MHCYCANYYGAVNCHNKVSQFGDRCKLCTVMNEGTSSRYEMFRQSSNESSGESYDTSRSSSSREERRGRVKAGMFKHDFRRHS
ncbi:hypothetical protein F4780DRAFT_780049 [Xylariomycetidae sp. FL0641]|nr:hypothetical protein F4780DRAFT_780049 [Xylariomycetidae sp. FL0641]